MGRPSQLVLPHQQVFDSVAFASSRRPIRRATSGLSERFSRRPRPSGTCWPPACRCPSSIGPDTVYSELLLKPLFSFAGKGIQFDPTQAQLGRDSAERRADYLLQQRMHFVPTIETPYGLTQAEIRILYMWPDGGRLTPALSLGATGPREDDGS